MGKGISVTGQKNVARTMLLAQVRAQKAAEKGLNEFALLLINEADKIVPFDTGQLENAVVNTPIKRGVKIVGYNTPYAAIQHENTSLMHPGPNSKNKSRGSKGQAKYLEKPLKENADKLGEITASRLKNVF